MSEPATEFVVRRILVALDASAQSLAALEAAVVVAGGLGAEIEGLFVEDINLMRLAMLPVARHILYPSAAEEPFSRSLIEHELKALARRAQRSLALMAGRSGIRWSFRVVRGKVAVEIMAAASGSDLLTVGKSGWSLARRMQLGSIAESAAVHAPKALLLVKQPLAVNRPVIALFDGSPLAEHALKAANRFGCTFPCPLTVFLATDSPQKANSLARQVVRVINAKGAQPKFRLLLATGALHLADAVESEAGGLLVLARSYERLPEKTIQHLIRLVSNSVLLVR